MGQATPIDIRHKIVYANERGRSYLSLSTEFKTSYNTVRTLCKAYKKGGLEALQPNYEACGKKGVIRSDYFIYRCAVWLRRRHPSWGADTVRAKLALRYPDRTLPGSRIIHQWFVNNGLVPKKRK